MYSHFFHWTGPTGIKNSWDKLSSKRSLFTRTFSAILFTSRTLWWQYNDNPAAFQVPYNANTLLQQQSIYRLKNNECGCRRTALWPTSGISTIIEAPKKDVTIIWQQISFITYYLSVTAIAFTFLSVVVKFSLFLFILTFVHHTILSKWLAPNIYPKFSNHLKETNTILFTFVSEYFLPVFQYFCTTSEVTTASRVFCFRLVSTLALIQTLLTLKIASQLIQSPQSSCAHKVIHV